MDKFKDEGPVLGCSICLYSKLENVMTWICVISQAGHSERVEQRLTLALLTLFLKSRQQRCGQAQGGGGRVGAVAMNTRSRVEGKSVPQRASLQMSRAGNILERKVKEFDTRLLRTQEVL